jgi:threonine/homoserine/homoserine lactone efflux protein
MHFSEITGDFLAGVLVGLSIAVPIGPSCLLCVQRCLAGGLASGLATGIGISTAHGLYAALALQGAGEVAYWVGSYADAFKICSVCLLFVLAARAFRSVPFAVEGRQPRPTNRGVYRFSVDYGSAMLLGMTNPMTVLFFFAVIPSITGVVGGAPVWQNTPYVVLGVATGSFAWWSVVVIAINFASRSFLDERRVRLVNRASALSLVLVGLTFLMPVLNSWTVGVPHGAAITVQDGASKSDALSFDWKVIQ